MKMLNHTTAAISLALATGLATAQPMAEVDTSEWACEYCPPVETVSGWLMIGIGSVSGQAYKFADFTDLEDGGYGLGEGYGLYITDETFWRIEASNLFLGSRDLEIEGGRPGSWWLDLSYDETVRFDNETGFTPFDGVGSNALTLPDGWVRGIGTTGLTALDATLRPLDLATDRRRIGLGLGFTPPGRFEYDVSYQRETKEGTRTYAGANMFVASLLPAPVDYVTDEVRASVTYLTDGWQASVSYYGSFFENDSRDFSWEVPFRPLIRDADVGQFDLGPDNEYHLVSLAGHYRFGPKTHFMGQVSIGQLDQDDAFLPYTTNPLVPVGALPRTSLDGEVDVFDVTARLDTEVLDGLGLDLTYRLNDRDNQTPVSSYTPVVMDLYANPARVNDPFSYERQSIELGADYRLSRKVRWYAGADFVDTERTFDQRADTDESRYWTRLRLGLGDRVEAALKFAAAERDGAVLDPVPGVNLAENPALRKFNYADRDRREAQASLSLMPLDMLQITLAASVRDDDYDESPIGLTAGESSDATIDVALSPTAGLTLHAFYARENLESDIAGEALIEGDFTGIPNWRAELEDRIRTGGAGIAWKNIAEKDIDLSVDFVYSRSDSSYDVDDGTSATPFPDFVTRLDGLRLRGSYPLPDGARLFLEYYREEYESDDWTVDGLEVDAVFNLLSFGLQAHQYDVDTFAIWYRRPF